MSFLFQNTQATEKIKNNKTKELEKREKIIDSAFEIMNPH
jgi:hypothetical protein